jgi:hypothetical protein
LAAAAKPAALVPVCGSEAAGRTASPPSVTAIAGSPEESAATLARAESPAETGTAGASTTGAAATAG